MSEGTELPLYKCHKNVRALKIKSIERDAVTILHFEEPGYAPISVSYRYDEKFSPEVGGYYVVYEDGYTSYSPAKAFEDGYTRVEAMAQGASLPGLIRGERDRQLAENAQDSADLKKIHLGTVPPGTTVTKETLEQMIQAKGLTAPRVTPADIEANIAQEFYFTAADGYRFGWITADHETHDQRAAVYSITSSLPVRGYGGACADIDASASTPKELSLLTFCVLVLKNGFTVTGESACASPENFDAELGRKIARQNAVSKVWPLMGYQLRERLSAG